MADDDEKPAAAAADDEEEEEEEEDLAKLQVRENRTTGMKATERRGQTRRVLYCSVGYLQRVSRGCEAIDRRGGADTRRQRGWWWCKP